MRGISYEREYAEWCRWMADSIEGRKLRENKIKSEKNGG